MARVLLQKIRKKYTNGFEAVHGIDLEVADGEFMVLVGPSGCAKSTTLRMVAGLEDISSGDLLIGERRVNDLSPSDRNIAMVFQDYALYPHMSVYENMAYGLRIRKYKREEIDRRVKKAAGILGLEEQLERKPKALSGGQRQRVAVGRAIVREPDVFLFDEPLSNLDAKLRVHMRAEIIRIQKALGTTMIYVTHDQVEAMTMGDRICVLNSGRIMQVAAPLELYDFPANRFVATFIGSPAMNIIRGQLKKDGNNLAFMNQTMKLTVPPGKSGFLESYNGKEIDLGLRPEHISIDMSGKAAADVVTGEVGIIELMGNEKIIHAVAGDTIICRTDPHCRAEKGRPAGMVFNMDKAHFFDPESGMNLTLG
ncbi:MAG: sn-glycerol-3-phosphate ABC transporter ATP-binding protein UgpC [Candidatus Wallbacteria bacterium]|nr:sn-glycerol-3-phosphate ABC transporter ATP-binding protein UgpC [Candidatus Wallbacteria bacterium]